MRIGRTGVSSPSRFRRVLDLATIRARLGSEWPNYHESVFMIAESVARRQAQHRCTLLRQGDSLVITFAGCRESEADRMFLAIKQTLYEMLFSEEVNVGEPALGTADHAPRPQRRRQTAIGRLYRVVWHALVRKRGYRRLNKALSELRGAARQSVVPSHGLALENASGVGWTHAAEPRAAAVRGVGPPAMERPVKRPPAAAGHIPPASPGPTPGSTSSPVAREAAPLNFGEVQKLEAAINLAAIRAARRHLSDPSMIEATLRQVRFVFKPLWHIRSRSLPLYRFCPARLDDGLLTEGDAVLPARHSRDAKAMLDQIALANLLPHLETLASHHNSGLVVLPIHASSLSEEWSRDLIVKLCDQVAKPISHRIIFSVCDAQEGRTDIRFRNGVQALRPFCRRIGAELPLNTIDMRFWRELGFATVCTNLGEADGPEADILNELGRFQSAARSMGLIATALDVPSRSLTIGAAALGFDFVQSPLIARYNVGITLGLTTFGVADLYQEWLEPA